MELPVSIEKKKGRVEKKAMMPIDVLQKQSQPLFAALEPIVAPAANDLRCLRRQ